MNNCPVKVFSAIKLILLIFPTIILHISPELIKFRMLIAIHILCATFFDLYHKNYFGATFSLVVLALLFCETRLRYFWHMYFIWNVLFSIQLLSNPKMGLIFGILHNLPAYMHALSSNPSLTQWATLRAQTLGPFFVYLLSL